jgi:hypothetical protein
MPLCVLQMEKNPRLGLEKNVDKLFKRIVEREGISKMTEFRPEVTAENYIKSFDKLRSENEGGQVQTAE